MTTQQYNSAHATSNPNAVTLELVHLKLTGRVHVVDVEGCRISKPIPAGKRHQPLASFPLHTFPEKMFGIAMHYTSLRFEGTLAA